MGPNFRRVHHRPKPFLKTQSGVLHATNLVIGVRQETGLTKDVELLLGERGGIHIDEHRRTSNPVVWAAVDVGSPGRPGNAAGIVADANCGRPPATNPEACGCTRRCFSTSRKGILSAPGVGEKEEGRNAEGRMALRIGEVGSENGVCFPQILSEVEHPVFQGVWTNAFRPESKGKIPVKRLTSPIVVAQGSKSKNAVALTIIESSPTEIFCERFRSQHSTTLAEASQ